MTKKSDIFQIKRIEKLTKLELAGSKDLAYSTDKMVAKTAEEVLELTIEILKDNDMGIIEESYDVINTNVSLMLMLGIEDIAGLIDGVNKHYTGEVNPINLIEYARKLNSYAHIDTTYQSKTGLTSVEDLKKCIIYLMIDVVCFVSDSSRRLSIINGLSQRKLDKWENKLIV